MGLGGSADALQIVAAVAAAGGQAVGAKLHGVSAVVLKPQHHKAVLRVDGGPDQPLLGVRLGQHTFGGIVQHRAHDRADLPCRQKVQQRTVRHTGQIDAVLLAVERFRRQQRVQHRVAGLVLGLVLADAALHLGQRGVLLGLVALGTDGRDLHFQLMIAAVNKADVLLALPVLLILAVQDVVHGRQLAVQCGLAQLFVLDRQDQHARHIHQRADVENAYHAHRDTVVGDKAQIADRKRRDRHDDSHQRRRRGNGQPRGRSVAALKPIQKAVDRRVDRRQQQYRKRCCSPLLRPEYAVELPLHAGGQLRQNERAGAAVTGFQ